MITIKIDWMEGFANDPRIIIEGMEMLKHDASLPYHKSQGLHRQDYPDGHVHYFYTDGNPTHGFGGVAFKGVLTTGEQFAYRGAWSSRAACINAEFPHNPVVDVTIGYCATALTIRRLCEIYNSMEPAPKFGLCAVDQGDASYTVEPTYPDGSIKSRGTIKGHFNGDIDKFLTLWKDKA